MRRVFHAGAAALAVLAAFLPCRATSGEDNEDRIVAAVRGSRPRVAAITSVAASGDEQNLKLRFSGVCISENGLIVTVADAVTGKQDVEVRLFDGRTFKAELVGADGLTNVAVIRIPATGLACVSDTSSRDIEAGATVIAIGNPFGFGHSVSTGVVSATGRTIRSREFVFKDMIQTTAPVNPGDAGGFLCDSRGRFVGMITSTFGRSPSFFRVRSMMSKWMRDFAKDPEFFQKLIDYFIMKRFAGADKTKEQEEFEKKISEMFEKLRNEFEEEDEDYGAGRGGPPGPSRGGQRGPGRGGQHGHESPFSAHGINFVMPAHQVLEIAREIVRNGRIIRGQIGASGKAVSALTAEEAEKHKVPAGCRGVLIDRIAEGGPAERAGVLIGDVLQKLNGAETAGIDELRDLVFSLKPGTKAVLDLVRGGEMISIHVDVEERK